MGQKEAVQGGVGRITYEKCQQRFHTLVLTWLASLGLHRPLYGILTEISQSVLLMREKSGETASVECGMFHQG